MGRSRAASAAATPEAGRFDPVLLPPLLSPTIRAKNRNEKRFLSHIVPDSPSTVYSAVSECFTLAPASVQAATSASNAASLFEVSSATVPKVGNTVQVAEARIISFSGRLGECR